MSEREERLEAFSEEFEEESVENRPSQSWSEVDQDPSPSSSDSEYSTSPPQLEGADSPSSASSSSPLSVLSSSRRLSTTSPSEMSTSPTQVDSGDGIMVEISSTPRAIKSLQGTMFKKEDRSSLSMEKRTELFEKIISKSLDTKFAEISVTLSDAEKLDDTYNVALLIDKMKDHCVKYDLHGVFNIVDAKDPKNDSSID
jgi:hypothetical protein